MSPDSRTLAEMDPQYRVAWASWVVARLRSLVGPLDQMVVRVDAPTEFIGPLFADLQDAGAVVSSGAVIALGTDAHASADPAPEAVEPAKTSPDRVVQLSARHLADEPGADPLSASRTPVAVHLADTSRAVALTDLPSLPRTPGLYGWIVDPAGARALNRSLKLPIAPGLVFVGQVGGSSWHSLVDPVVNLRDHIDLVQLHGRTRASTFRMTLATALGAQLGMTSMEDPVLTRWMLDHLLVTTWAVPDGEGLRELAHLLVTELDPPLNVDHLPATEYRDRLQQLRTALA